MSLRESAADLLPHLIELRRSLHRDPEIGLFLPHTRDIVVAELSSLGLDPVEGKRCSSVVAVVHGDHPGPSVLLRADMDALPVTEATGLPFAATNGAMHACGHDLHTAGLLGAAHLLTQHRDQLHGTVVLMFQPGEEGYNGARVMIDEGLFDTTDEPPIAAFAMHVGPGPRGVFATRPGPIMAGSSRLAIVVHGRGGHGSHPQSAVDPIAAIAEIVGALQTMVSQRVGVADPVVLTVTRLNAGTADNAIPEEASLVATVRTFSVAALEIVEREATRIAEGIAAAHGARAEITLERLYAPTTNDPVEAEAALEVLRSTFGNERVVVPAQPMMGSEDFSEVLAEIPGCYVFLSTTSPALVQEPVEINHSPRVVFDDAVLGDLALALASLAIRRLHRSAAARAPLFPLPH